MKIGDKVRYLNAVGGGTITNIGEKGIITVLEDDGFETPVLACEVVVVEQTNELNFKTNTPPKTQTETQSRTTKQEAPKYSFDTAEETLEGEKISLSLAFVPADIKNLQSSPVELFIINESNYYINFQLLTGNGTTPLHSTDTIEPQTKLFIADISKECINDYEYLRIQGFAFKKNKIFDTKPSIDMTLRINPVDFYKLHRFVDNDFFEAKAMILTVLDQDYQPIKHLIDEKQLKEAMHEKRHQPTKKQFSLPRKQELIEIDLHIHELIDNLANLSNADILSIQLEKFHSVMKKNIGKKGQKIVFIHGKGEGVLRKSIIDSLKKEYKNTSFQDASFQQYGFGATQVNIH